MLDKIVAKTEERLVEAKRNRSLDQIIEEVSKLEINDDFPFKEALKDTEIAIIAEVKKASPSKGLIAEDFDYIKIAKEYEQAGASAISVLTEPYFFKGSNDYLKEIAENVSIPILRKDFTIDEYIDCIKYAHMRNIKVFLTLNTLTYDSEIKEALELVLELYKNGLDAVIVQDIGLAMLIRKLIPELPLHASTQMSVYSLEQVKFLESLGFKRVVLSRELSIEEIEYICNNSDIEIECFIHGALCISYSGQCLFSSMVGGRSGNRGKCARALQTSLSIIRK